MTSIVQEIECPSLQEIQKHEGKGYVKTHAEVGEMQLQGMLTAIKAGRRKEGFSPRSFRGSTALPTP